MKSNFSLVLLLLVLSSLSCTSNVEYSESFKKQTSGKYLFNADDVMTVSYVDNELFLDWRGIKRRPIATAENEIFIPDLYKKLHFVTHPETKTMYLSIISEKNPDSISYDYIKVADEFKTPSEYIKLKDFDNALIGLQKIKEKDSLSDFINQYKFNRIGYRYLKAKNYKDAIAIFTMNTKLHPKKPNTFDSLANAYLVSGDSAKAYENYKKTLALNIKNKRAQKFVNTFEGK